MTGSADAAWRVAPRVSSSDKVRGLCDRDTLGEEEQQRQSQVGEERDHIVHVDAEHVRAEDAPGEELDHHHGNDDPAARGEGGEGGDERRGRDDREERSGSEDDYGERARRPEVSTYGATLSSASA